MFGYLRGVIRHIEASYVVMDVNGVGYEVYLNSSTLSSLSESDSESELYTHLNVREDGYTLYGFTTLQERDLFRVLLSISKIGPKIAMAILSKFSVSELVSCVQLKDSQALVQVPGIGIKTASRLMMDLYDKVSRFESDIGEDIEKTTSNGNFVQEAIDALVVMGFSQKESRRAVLAIQEQANSTENAVRLALATVEVR